VEGDLQRAIGRNVRAYRLSRGLSQEAFAVLLNVHRTYMGGLERGERNLTLRSVERLAAKLGVEPLELLR
jgi:transcriptional regulator with XRE-family HTH domain